MRMNILFVCMLLKLALLINSTPPLITHSLIHKLLDNTTHKLNNSVLDNFFEDGVWVAFVNLGTPPQTLALTYDLESDISIIESLDCTTCLSKTFNKTNSSSYKTIDNDTYTYGRYHIFEDGIDTVEITTLNNTANTTLQVGLVDFVTPTNDSDTGNIDFLISGTFGLGYQKTCNKSSQCNLGTRLKLDGVVSQNIFGVFLVPEWERNYCKQNPGTCPELLEDGGAIIFGGYDTTLFSDPNSPINWLPIIDQEGLWKININDILIEKNPSTYTIDLKNQTAVLSMTDTRIVFSVEIANNITSLVGGSFDPQFGYIGPCHNDLIVGFTLGIDNTLYLATPQELYKKVIPNSNSTCFSGFTDTTITQLSHWVLGTPFLTNIYAIFDIDNSKVGIANPLNFNI